MCEQALEFLNIVKECKSYSRPLSCTKYERGKESEAAYSHRQRIPQPPGHPYPRSWVNLLKPAGKLVPSCERLIACGGEAGDLREGSLCDSGLGPIGRRVSLRSMIHIHPHRSPLSKSGHTKAWGLHEFIHPNYPLPHSSAHTQKLGPQ